MSKTSLFYTYGNDSEMIEKKFLPDIEKRYPAATILRYDATIDTIFPQKITTEYLSNNLFGSGKVIIIRNADSKPEIMSEVVEAIASSIVAGNALVLLGSGLNGTTKFGKAVKAHCSVNEFSIPEIKPFDLLEAISIKNTGRALLQSRKLFMADYPPLAMYSLLCGHFLLMKKVKDLQHLEEEDIARELKEHSFRIKKMCVATRYWSNSDILNVFKSLSKLGDLLRTWQYDEQMLLQMFLINVLI